MKKLIQRAAIATAFAAVAALPAVPASAAPVITGGLINVTVVDVLSGVQVTAQVPITVAANICGTTVALLAQDLNSGPVDCSTPQEIITVSQQRSNRPRR